MPEGENEMKLRRKRATQRQPQAQPKSLQAVE